MRAFEYRHIVGFQETNLVGNVYFVNHLAWQGRCREMFLHELAPGVVDDMARGLKLITTRCSCEYVQELAAFDVIVVRMRLAALLQNRMTLAFEYWRQRSGAAEALVARGEQQIAFMRPDERGSVIAAAIPEELRAALKPFGGE